MLKEPRTTSLYFCDLAEGFAILRRFDTYPTHVDEARKALHQALPAMMRGAMTQRGTNRLDVDFEDREGRKTALLQLVISIDE